MYQLFYHDINWKLIIALFTNVSCSDFSISLTSKVNFVLIRWWNILNSCKMNLFFVVLLYRKHIFTIYPLLNSSQPLNRKDYLLVTAANLRRVCQLMTSSKLNYIFLNQSYLRYCHIRVKRYFVNAEHIRWKRST